MTPQTHAAGGSASPELKSELKTLKMAVESHQSRGSDRDKALGTIQSAIAAAEAGKDDEARSIVADAWDWVKDNLSLDGLAENASELGEKISAGASELGEKISEGTSDLGDKISDGWASLFGGDETTAETATEERGADQA